VRAAQNHPSVVFYSMSHNATGTEEEDEPGIRLTASTTTAIRWSGNNVKQALRAEAIRETHGPKPHTYLSLTPPRQSEFDAHGPISTPTFAPV